MLAADRGWGRWLMGWLSWMGDWIADMRGGCVHLSGLESDALCLHFPIDKLAGKT